MVRLGLLDLLDLIDLVELIDLVDLGGVGCLSAPRARAAISKTRSLKEILA